MSERPDFEPPARVLLCLHPDCFGYWHLPLTLDERMVCPTDSTHRVAVYSSPNLHAGLGE